MIDIQGREVLDPDKAATTTATGHLIRGVRLASRYHKAAEYDAMLAVMTSLPPGIVRRMRSMWCDSKAYATYSIDGDLTQYDLDAIGIAFVEQTGGHNGIWGPGGMCVDPDWQNPGEGVPPGP